MANRDHRGLKDLAEILGELLTVRGYVQLRAKQELEDIWNKAVGQPDCWQTQVGEVRRGVLNVTVAHSTLLEELAGFRKPTLLLALRSVSPGASIHDIRFRLGVLAPDAQPLSAPLLGATDGPEEAESQVSSRLGKGTRLASRRARDHGSSRNRV
jgi:hypothetical protein